MRIASRFSRTAALAATALGLSLSAAQAQISDTVVRIGVLTDLSGLYADLAGRGSVEATKMAVEDFLAANPNPGFTIEVLEADHQNKGDIASAKAQEWFDTAGVDAITDLVTSSTALAAQKIGGEKGRVTIVNGAASSDLTGKNCTATGIHYTYDTYALANGTGRAVVETGGDTWFFVTADYAFGNNLEAQVTKVVTEMGGKVIGGVKHPFPGTDFSSFLLQAQQSGAKVVGLANAGSDVINSIKQAAEFGITEGGQALAGLLVFISDVHALGLDTAQGLRLTTAYYWDRDDASREFASRFEARMPGRKPTMVQAGQYSSTLHYLNAIKAIGTDDGVKVVEQMKKTPVNDFFAQNATIYPNGRLAKDMYLAQVKTPAESKGPWDYYTIVKTIPADQAFLKPEAAGCPLVK